MNSRDKILQKLRSGMPQSQTEELPLQPDGNYFKDLREGAVDELISQFAEKLRALSGEFFVAQNEKEAASLLLEIFDTIDDGDCLAQPHESIARVLALNEKLADRFEMLPGELDGDLFAEYAAGLSTVDFLIARTGSIVLRNIGAGGRRLSVLPPVHIALAWQNQIVPSLDAALQAELITDSEWSYATIISGPSRTADIQKNLVLGAHGPKQLIVVLIKKDR